MIQSFLELFCSSQADTKRGLLRWSFFLSDSMMSGLEASQYIYDVAAKMFRVFRSVSHKQFGVS